MEKLKIHVDKALPMIQEMIRPIAISREVGKSAAWLINRKNHNKRGEGNALSFSEYTISVLNSGLQSIGERLLQTKISYGKERNETITEIKKLSEIVQMKYIYERVMGKKRSWFYNRTKKGPAGSCNPCFSDDDVLAINIAILGIANKILSIELTL